MHAAFGGLWLWEGLGKAGDLSSVCSCCLLQVQVRLQVPGPLDGLAPVGKKEQAKLCLKELLVGEAPACGRALLWDCLAVSGLCLAAA